MIVAGFGFRASATVESLRDAYGLAGGGAERLATVADKAESPVFAGFAAALDLPVTKVNPETLHEQDTASHSEASQMARGTGSVSEAAALAAAGPGARLVAARVVSRDGKATCALARSAASTLMNPETRTEKRRASHGKNEGRDRP